MDKGEKQRMSLERAITLLKDKAENEPCSCDDSHTCDSCNADKALREADAIIRRAL